MGTHPIFESDFDCLTDSWPMSSSMLRFIQLKTAVRSKGIYPIRNLSISAQSLGPKKKAGKKGGKGGGKNVTVEPLKAEKDANKLQEFCCGLNIWSEKASEIFNVKEEDKEAFFSDPKLKPKEEYPDWLWDPELLLDINELTLEEIDQDKNPELYWKKYELEKQRLFDVYNDGKLWLEDSKPHPGKINFISKFPDIEIKPRSEKLKAKIIRSAPYANQ